jgi:hypothetical protein
MSKPKILLYDIETAPRLGYVWGEYEQNVIRVVKESYILCFSYKWFGDKTVKVVSLPDFKLYKRDREDDRDVVRALWSLFDEADYLIGHNSDSFDNRWAAKQFVYHSMKPPSPNIWIDTKKIAKRYFRFDSNSLDKLGEFLGVGRKVKHDGVDTWFDCMSGDVKAWRTMIRYAKGDVDLLERVYLKLRPYHTSHPNINSLPGMLDACPKCGSKNIIARGSIPTNIGRKRRWSCNDCGGWSVGKVKQIKGMEIR